MRSSGTGAGVATDIGPGPKAFRSETEDLATGSIDPGISPVCALGGTAYPHGGEENP